MFNEREMSKAIDWLFELFSPEDYEGYDEDEIGYAGGLCLPEVCTALRGAAQVMKFEGIRCKNHGDAGKDGHGGSQVPC